MKKLLLLFSILFLCNQNNLHAQDAHFSQYFNKPLLLNPSLAGNGIEYIRLTAIYRNQWTGIGDPFTTQGFSVDKVVNRIGLGTMITRNGGGTGAIATLNLVGNLAYHLPLDHEKNHTLSVGVQLGIVNKSFDPSKLTFDNQYNPDQGYDPTQGNGEVFTTTSVTRPDLNAGLFWQRGWLKKDILFKPFFGIAFSHLNRPVETFIIDDSRVDIKNTFYGGAGIMLNERIELKPSFLHVSQGTFNETTFGTNLNYIVDSKNQFQLGAYHRVNDAVIAYAGYQMNQFYVGTSYDINTGELSKTGKGTNAFEISIAYSPRPKKKKEPTEIKVTPPKNRVINKTIPEIKPALIPNNITQEVVTKPTTEIIKYIFIPNEVIATSVTTTKTTETKTVVKTPVKPEVQTVVPKVTTTPISTINTSIVPVKTENKNVIEIPAQPDMQITIPNETVTPVSAIKTPTIHATTTDLFPATKQPISTTIKIPEEVIVPEITVPVDPKSDLTKTIVATQPQIPSAIQSDKLVTEKFSLVIPNEVVEPMNTIIVTPEIILPAQAIATKPEITIPVDSDKDGIADADDRCPFIKGSKLTNGCPDSDSDGLIDMDDDCPLASGLLTNKGCPDPNVPEPKNNQELIKTFDHILFSKGSIKMATDDIYDIVERAVDMLYADKTLIVLLSGHTDSEGDASFNMNLSQNRTDVVKAYLLKQGIPETRIQTVGYGETMPVRNNLFEETMKQNRRVELNILKRK